MSGHGEKSRVPTFDGKQENYDMLEMQWNECVQVKQFMDALEPKGHTNMPADHKT
jgi:hypothetical protein